MALLLLAFLTPACSEPPPAPAGETRGPASDDPTGAPDAGKRPDAKPAEAPPTDATTVDSRTTDDAAVPPEAGLDAVEADASRDAIGAPSDAGPIDAHSPPLGPCPPDALVCDDFEKHATGATPGTPWRTRGAPKVTTERAFSGTRSVLTDAGQLIRLDLSPRRDLVFGRMMFWMTDSPVDHWTFAVASVSTYAARYGQQRRYGKEIMSNYHWGGGEAEFVSRTKIPTQQWVCLEWSFDRRNREFQFWLDGRRIDEASKAYTRGPAIPGPWESMAVGQEIYGGQPSRKMFVDDVVFSTTRIGCPVGAQTPG